MVLTADDPHRIAKRTLAHYDQHAQAYWEGTRDHDVRQNIGALLEHIGAPPPFDLLDFGCGPGRDLSTFKALGHRAIGLEGSPQLAAMARTTSGCEVLEQNFLALDLPGSHFDGVFANAVLFHIPSQELPRILRQLHATLKPGGVLFSSNPRGAGQEGWNGERYGAFYDWPTWNGHVSAAGFAELTHFYRPAGGPIVEGTIALAAPALLTSPSRVRTEQHATWLQRCMQFPENPRQFLAGNMEQHRIGEHAVEMAGWQV